MREKFNIVPSLQKVRLSKEHATQHNEFRVERDSAGLDSVRGQSRQSWL